VREALFNILRDDCAGARVLDLYAGTGALGLEAISRGAIFAVFVERSKEALAALNANIAALGQGPRTRVLSVAVERAARELGKNKNPVDNGGATPFDLVFADPPYADVKNGEALRAIVTVLDPALFSPRGRLVLEHAHRDPSPAIEGLTLDEARTYGDTSLSFYSAPSPLAVLGG
jgi:16S rRNA (guanine966-N2)-methyltransferase